MLARLLLITTSVLGERTSEREQFSPLWRCWRVHISGEGLKSLLFHQDNCQSLWKANLILEKKQQKLGTTLGKWQETPPFLCCLLRNKTYRHILPTPKLHFVRPARTMPQTLIQGEDGMYVRWPREGPKPKLPCTPLSAFSGPAHGPWPPNLLSNFTGHQ